MIAKQIKIDMRQVVEALLRRIARSQWCAGCGELAEMVSGREAADLTNTSLRRIYRWAETGRVHFQASRDGALLVCAKSLPPSDAITQEFRVRSAKLRRT